MRYKLITEAGKKLAQLGARFRTNVGPMDPGKALGLFGPDVAFGVMAGVQTPGDLTDKLIAGTGSAVGGALGGVGLTGVIGVKNPGVKYALDFGGSLIGDNLGMAAADEVLRMKNGATPWEQQQAAYEMQLRDEIKRELLARNNYNS